MTTYINADDGIVSGVAGLKYGADNSGSLVLQTNGTTAITISASQVVTFTNAVNFNTAAFTNLSYTGTLTGGTGVINIGSGQFYKDASGSIGVGTVSPTSIAGYGAITVNGSGSGSFLDLQTSGTLQARILSLPADLRINQIVSGSLSLWTTNTERMRIDSSGNVGVGTSSPSQKLDIASRVAFNTSNAYGRINIARATDSGLTALYIQGADNAGTANELSLVNAGGGGAAINITGGDLRFYASSNTTERMRIDSSGNVGIGTSTPTAGYKLDISGNTKTTGYYSVNDVGYIRSSTGLLEFQGGSTATRFMDSSYSSELMRITQAGNVGIGTSSPSTFNSKLAVAGNSGTGPTQLTVSGGGNSGDYGIVSVATSTTIRGRMIADATSGDLRFDTAGSAAGGIGFYTGSSYAQRFIIGAAGQLGIGASPSYGTAGQVMVSGGPSAAPSWGSAASAGQVIQVVQTTNTSRSATSCANGGTDLPGMSVTITPSSASNKILVLINIAFNAPENENLVGLLLRNGTLLNQNTSGPGVAGFFGIATANDNNYHMWSASGCYLDSPASTSALTYKLQGGGTAGTRTLYLNGTGRNSLGDATGSSTITVMEIKG